MNTIIEVLQEYKEVLDNWYEYDSYPVFKNIYYELISFKFDSNEKNIEFKHYCKEMEEIINYWEDPFRDLDELYWKFLSFQ